MTKEETWNELVRLGAVSGRMPEGRWDLRGINLGTIWKGEAEYSLAYLEGFDFVGADLSGAILKRTILSKANLTGALLIGANLIQAVLDEANLTGALLTGANFANAGLSGANLTNADLSGANLTNADLSGANLTGANLSNSLLIGANLERAKLNNCHVYGISAWDLRLHETEQTNLIITPEGQPVITVDNLKIAQFIYLLLNNPEIRDVLNSIASKVVLILGRFTDERKAVLDALRKELQQRDYIPIMFDFIGPNNRNITETVSTLAHMARFVIADITDPRSIPQELMAIVPHLPSVPVQPILQASSKEYGMFKDFKGYTWVLPIYHYRNLSEAVASVSEKIIAPAESFINSRLPLV